MARPIAPGGACRGSALSAQLWGCPAARENWETPSRPAGVAEGQADPVKKPPGRITPWAKSSRIKRGRKSGAVIHHGGGVATRAARGFGLSCWGGQPGPAATLRSAKGRGDLRDSQLPGDHQQGATRWVPAAPGGCWAGGLLPRAGVELKAERSPGRGEKTPDACRIP